VFGTPTTELTPEVSVSIRHRVGHMQEPQLDKEMLRLEIKSRLSRVWRKISLWREVTATQQTRRIRRRLWLE